MKVYLIGFKNSGKTTAGRKLARKLKLNFLDLDDLIEKNDGRTVPEIFSQDGEDVFREKERSALQQTAGMDKVVISTGGGVPRFFNNMDFMLENGTTVYLKLDEDTLVGRLRIAAQNRPILKGKSPEEIRSYVQDLLRDYEHYYLRAKYVVDAKNLAPEEIVSRVLENY
ncbi:MAG TPA: shikimate kinase [Bacteroidales bacterium]|nr:shikimate kinase [Bacteroidales bacterium]